jgi:hypothetical protein
MYGSVYPTRPGIHGVMEFAQYIVITISLIKLDLLLFSTCYLALSM